jgi:hypothetical protein
MKNLFLLGLVLVLTLSCQNTEQRYFTSSPEIDTVKELVSDYQNGNWEKWMTHYADTAKIYHNTAEGASASETKESLNEILSNVSSYKFDEKPVFYEMIIDDEGEKWVYFWANWRGTLAANNQEIVIPVHIAANMVDGLIVEEYGYYDVSNFVAALNEIEANKVNVNTLEAQ